jgi:hypothetical protein
MTSLEKKLVDLTVALEIEDFLSGKTDGQALFEWLYGAVADEPVPEQMLALVRSQCTPVEIAETAPPAAAAQPGLGTAAS